MEWLGTGFVLTVGGMRLRVRIALEDAPCPEERRRMDERGGRPHAEPPHHVRVERVRR